ncbi:MAG: DinB family protein [Armatimonadota bacterium]
MPTAERVSELIQAYAEGPALLESAVAGLSEEERRFTPGPEQWSIHENIVHLVDTDLVAAARMRYVLAQPGKPLVAFDQNHWARVMDYASQSFEEALALFRAIRASTAGLLRHAHPEAWAQTGLHTESGPQTLEWIVEHFVDHVHHHTGTIAKRRRQHAEARAAEVKP